MNHPDDLVHVASCRECRDRFVSENVVSFDQSRRNERLREITETARRLERERVGAREIVARLLRDTPFEEWPHLVEHPDLRNNAALEQISEEVRRRLDRHPVEALALANLATSIAESLPNHSYPGITLAQLRATAWRDRGNALRYLGRYEEALSAVSLGKERLAEFAAVAYDRAVVQLVEGMILAQMDRFDDAESVIGQAREIFFEHGDTKRYLQAGLIEGNLLYRRARYASAQRTYGELICVAVGCGDVESQASIHNNLGYCAAHLGQYAEANIQFGEAVAKFSDLGFHSEVPRTERGAGLVLIGKGQISGGLARLREARRAFTAFGMVEEAGLCALNILEVLIERGEASEARVLARALVEEFTAARLDKHAVSALADLRDSVESSDATPATVRHVQGYIESLRTAASLSHNTMM